MYVCVCACLLASDVTPSCLVFYFSLRLVSRPSVVSSLLLSCIDFYALCDSSYYAASILHHLPFLLSGQEMVEREMLHMKTQWVQLAGHTRVKDTRNTNNFTHTEHNRIISLPHERKTSKEVYINTKRTKLLLICTEDIRIQHKQGIEVTADAWILRSKK